MKIIFLCLLVSSRVFAAPASVPAVRLHFEVDKGLPPDPAEHLGRWYRQSLQMLRQFSPKGPYLLNWQGDRKPLRNKSVWIRFPSQVERARLAASGATYIQPDFGTHVFNMKKDFQIQMVGHAEYFFDQDGKPRVGAFAIFLYGFAREVYGNVQQLLEVDPTKLASLLSESRPIDIRQSKTSIRFLERLIASPEFKVMKEEDQAYLQTGLTRERKDLARLEQEERLNICLPVLGRDY